MAERWTRVAEDLVVRAMADAVADEEGVPRLTDEEWASSDPGEAAAHEELLRTMGRLVSY